jgi:hypothetical protein
MSFKVGNIYQSMSAKDPRRFKLILIRDEYMVFEYVDWTNNPIVTDKYGIAFDGKTRIVPISQIQDVWLGLYSSLSHPNVFTTTSYLNLSDLLIWESTYKSYWKRAIEPKLLQFKINTDLPD